MLPRATLTKKIYHRTAPNTVTLPHLLQVYRVILDDGRKLVGVRFPTTALPYLRQHLTDALQIRKAVVAAGGGGTIEPVVPLDPKSLRLAKTAPKTMLSFFGAVPARTSTAPSSALLPSPVTAAKRKSTLPPGSDSGGSSGGMKKGRRVGLGCATINNGGLGNVSKGMAALFGSRVNGGGGAGGKQVVCAEVTIPDDDGHGGGGAGGGAGMAAPKDVGENNVPAEVIAIDDD